MAQETHADIRKYIAEKVSSEVAQQVRIQYGGSMKGANAVDLLKQVSSVELHVDYQFLTSSIAQFAVFFYSLARY